RFRGAARGLWRQAGNEIAGAAPELRIARAVAVVIGGTAALGGDPRGDLAVAEAGGTQRRGHRGGRIAHRGCLLQSFGWERSMPALCGSKSISVASAAPLASRGRTLSPNALAVSSVSIMWK